MNPPRFVAASHVADLLSVSERTVLAWARNGTLPAIRLGRLWRFDLDSVLVRLAELEGTSASLVETRAPEPSSTSQVPGTITGVDLIAWAKAAPKATRSRNLARPGPRTKSP